MGQRVNIIISRHDVRHHHITTSPLPSHNINTTTNNTTNFPLLLLLLFFNDHPITTHRYARQSSARSFIRMSKVEQRRRSASPSPPSSAGRPSRHDVRPPPVRRPPARPPVRPMYGENRIESAKWDTRHRHHADIIAHHRHGRRSATSSLLEQSIDRPIFPFTSVAAAVRCCCCRQVRGLIPPRPLRRRRQAGRQASSRQG